MAAVGRPRGLPPLLAALLLVLSRDAEGGGPRPSSPGDNGRPTGPHTVPTPEAQFALKVLVLDSASRQPVPGASVSVYLNHSVSSWAQTDPRGQVLFWVGHSPQLSLTLLGHKRGYVPRPLAWSTSRRPVLSVVTLLLLPHAQGNIWMFDDSVLITGKLPDSSSHLKVTFPKSLLLTSGRNNITSLTAYLTVPQRSPAPGLLSSRSAVASVSLTPLVALSVVLLCDGEQLQVRGPVHISLPLGPGPGLRPADTVPAWAFNFDMGAWENRGLGVVKAVGAELVWTYTASHLGHWMAAPLPSSEGPRGYRLSLDFLWYHTYLLMGTLAGMLLVLVGFLALLVCHCRRSQRPRRRTARFSRLSVVTRDQTTSTHQEGALLFQGEASSMARPPAAFNIYVEDPGGRPAAPFYENIPPDQNQGPQPPSLFVTGEEAGRPRETSEQGGADVFFPDKLINIFHQAVAVIQAPELFGPPDPLAACKAATFPRNGGEYDAHPEPAAKAPAGSPPRGRDEPRPLETPPQSQAPSAGGWGRYSSLLESSVSVPGTLNEAAGLQAFGGGGHGVPGELQGISERTLLELARGKPLLSHPRAWFVSLDGKPAAQVRHSIIELQGGPRPPSSNDTSLDSGVDMNEPPHGSRDADRPPRASSLSHHSRGGRGGEDADLSSSESGTTATCTPEDPALRSILDGGGGAVPDIPEEHEETDTSSESRGPPPRRLRKVRDKVKAEGRQAREGRPQSRRS